MKKIDFTDIDVGNRLTVSSTVSFPIDEETERITEDGTVRKTEDGQTRVLET